jgi:DNA-binding transcriptional MerR regulator
MRVGGSTWKIGEVAAATGLTVRALHHYDEIGLVRPSVRTEAGHRLYTGGDLATLYQVAALRQLGIALEQIGALLAERVGVREVIDVQLEHVDRQIREGERLRKQLLAARDQPGDADAFLSIIKLMQDMQGYFSQAQIEAMRRRFTELGVIGEHAVGVEMPRLYAEAQQEMRAGTPCSDPAVRRIVDRLDELSRILRGGNQNQEIGETVRELWLAKGRQRPEEYDSGDWGELVGYLDQARAARPEGSR